jgi:hypothetical protein
MAISMEDLKRFFDAKERAGFQCDFCGNQRYGSLFGLPNTPGEFQLYPAGATGYHAFYATVCRGCGRVTFWLAATIHEWLKNNPLKTS